MTESDGFVVLTENARGILFPESKETGSDIRGRPIEVIPCCVDLKKRFTNEDGRPREELRKELGVDKRRVYTHIGALGGLYLTSDIADLLATAREVDPSTYALFLTQTSPDLIIPELRKRGFGDNDFFVGRVSPAEIPRYLRASDVGLSFVKAGYATASRSPTKIPEYLACGLPIIANAGVGDVDRLINDNGIGVLLKDFSSESYREAIAGIEALGDVRERCIETAHREFDLERVGGERYRRIYRKLLGEEST
jgi:glycosyltransferase involved in cell wall biosynthesis